jgi:hypothetical protein
LANDLNLSSGAALSATSALAASLTGFSAGKCWRAILPDQLRVGQSPSGDGRCHLAESSAIVVFALVEPEGLLVEIGIKVYRINADVGSFEGPLQQTQKFSRLLVCTLPRTNSIAWSMTSCV